MDHLHHTLQAGPDDVIEVNLDHAANVMLLDAANYDNYSNGREYRYQGGHVQHSPYRLSPPHSGIWHLVVDLGGYPGTVRASVSILSLAKVS